ncbi:MAG: hypothetical protein AB7U82_34965 [Blastocatellales bacterium]
MSHQVLEGTWEEIAVHAGELAGKKLRLIVLEENAQTASDADEYAETVKAIQEGIESFNRGEGRPAREALEELRQKHGIPR